MSKSVHLYLFSLATTCWTLFLLGGLWSDYYQTSPALRSFLIIVLLPSWAYLRLSISFLGQRQVTNKVLGAFWLSFYFTVPLFFYDLIYLGAYNALGLSFMFSHWYLSVFYIIPWIISFGVANWKQY
jgi:hypothetical protein